MDITTGSRDYELFYACWEILYRELFNIVPPYFGVDDDEINFRVE